MDAKRRISLDSHLDMYAVWAETKLKLMAGWSSGEDTGPCQISLM